jgi:hypothetical protein
MMVVAVAGSSIGTVLAAPAAQDAPPSGNGAIGGLDLSDDQFTNLTEEQRRRPKPKGSISETRSSLTIHSDLTLWASSAIRSAASIKS